MSVLIFTRFLFALSRFIFGLGVAKDMVLEARTNKRGPIPCRKLRNLRTKATRNSLGFDPRGKVPLHFGRETELVHTFPPWVRKRSAATTFSPVTRHRLSFGFAFCFTRPARNLLRGFAQSPCFFFILCWLPSHKIRRPERHYRAQKSSFVQIPPPQSQTN